MIEFQHYELVRDPARAMGLDAEAAMLPFQPSVDHFHERTRPADWYESLMKAYVIDTVSADFYRAIVGRYVDAGTRSLIGAGPAPSMSPRRCCRSGSRRPWPMTRGWRRGWRCGPGACWGRP